MIIYTLGNSSSPKSAIYTEKLVSNMWSTTQFTDNLNKENATVLYLPISHDLANLQFKNQLAKRVLVI